MSKRRAIVTDVDDPRGLGRLKARLYGFGEGDADEQAETPWCWPAAGFVGQGSGLFFLPPVGAEIWVERTFEGDWAWTGGFWSDRQQPPEEADTDRVRVLQTPAGHKIKIDEGGAIEIYHLTGTSITLEQSGAITVNVEGAATVNVGGACDVTAAGKATIEAEEIVLNDDAGRVVTTECICTFTGAPHPQGSATVKAKGPF